MTRIIFRMTQGAFMLNDGRAVAEWRCRAKRIETTESTVGAERRSGAQGAG